MEENSKTESELQTEESHTEQDDHSLEHGEKLSEILEKITDPSENINTYGELIDRLSHSGMAVILVLFSIPAALPIPAAGYSTLLSIPLIAMGIRLIMGQETAWIPNKMRAREFAPQKNERMLRWMKSIFRFVERFSKPRWPALVQSRPIRITIGLYICLLALSMALPIPGTNTAPAGAVFLFGFALLEDDFLLMAVGFIYGIAAICLSVAIIFLGAEVVKQIIKAALSLGG